MTEPPTNVLELPLEQRAEMALKAAVERVIVEHARQGLPIYVWRDGREKQFVAGANERRQEIRDQDGSAISKETLCLRARWICLNDLPVAHVSKRVNSVLESDSHGDADSNARRVSCQISGLPLCPDTGSI